MPDLLVYSDELTDNEPLITAVYSVEWLPFLLGAVNLLRQPELWQGSTDMEKVSEQIDDLCARLMGVYAEDSIMATPLPFCVPATALFWSSTCTPTKEYFYADYYLTNRAYTDETDENASMNTWSLPLPAGEYVIEVIHDKTTNRGKFGVSLQGIGDVLGPIDCYAASWTKNVIAKATFTLTEAQNCVFEGYKLLKNPSSSAGRVVWSAVIIRKATAED